MNPGIIHTMTVGDLAGDEVESLGIQGVPAVFHERSMIHSGRASFGELLSALEEEFGFSDTEKAAEHSDFAVAVIGGGPAGCAAAIYSVRKGLKTAIIIGRIGWQVNDTAAMNKFGEILIDTHGRTSVKGIYAAGDVTTVPYKQIVIAMGEGAKSALTAFNDRIRL